MLKKVDPTQRQSAGERFAIVASEYNAQYVESMLAGAEAVLRKADAAVDVFRVPGAYEIPVVASRLARAKARPFAAVVCLGVILRGQTQHAQLIGEAVTTALMQIQVDTGIPVVHEVLLLENEEQARVRCLSPEHNRGIEAAQTALRMASVLGQIPPSSG